MRVAQPRPIRVKSREVVLRFPSSGGEGEWFGVHLLGIGAVEGGQAAAGEDFRSEVAFCLSPFIGFFYCGPSAGLFDQIWGQTSLGNPVKASRSSRVDSRC